jgi:hypothetical protein
MHSPNRRLCSLFEFLPFGLIIGSKFEMLGQVVDQYSNAGHNPTIGCEYEMDADFFAVPIGQDSDEALCADLILNHFGRQKGNSQTGCGSSPQYGEIARSQYRIE